MGAAKPSQSSPDLLTCLVDDVDESYSRVMHRFYRATRPGVVVFFRCLKVDDSLYFDGVRCIGTSAADDIAENLDGTPLLATGLSDIALPDTHEINSFVNFHIDRTRFADTPIRRNLLDPLDAHSVVRILVYRQRRFIGWLGCFRRANQSRTDGHLRRALEPMAEPICSALGALDEVRCSQQTAIDGSAVFSRRGSLKRANPCVRKFLDNSRQQQLAELITAVDSDDLQRRISVIDGHAVHISRLEGKDSLHYLVRFSSASTPRLNPLSRLTPAQREVAQYAAKGATNAEIARDTDRSVETVKVHIRNIYDRLNIGSRVELVQKLQDVEMSREHRE